MSRTLPLCRGFLEHLDMTMTNETFQVVSLDYCLHIEQKRSFRKGAPRRFLAEFVKDVFKLDFFSEKLPWAYFTE